MTTPKNILIVDDTPDNINVLKNILSPDGYQFYISTNGELAINVATKNIPDLILMDVMMPGIDGFETCKRLKNIEATKDIPIIFITAKNEPEDIVKGFKFGGVDYITKPLRSEEVCARVKTHLTIKGLMDELENKNKLLEETNELKNKFIGMASHDLRNPLASITGFSKILIEEKNDLTDEEINEFSNIIFSVSSNMSNLVENILDVSIIESGKLELNYQTHSILKLIEERVKIFKVFGNKKNIEIRINSSIIAEFLFDSDRITQVIDNLLSNAVKFSPYGKEIIVTLEKNDNFAKISVKDQGPGIDEEEQAKLYNPFQKLSAKPTGGETSTGLGLTIAKKLVDGHNGKIDILSEKNIGTTFSFSIPLEVKIER
jgi:two-component system, sensor histidine kinase and response regulator